MFFQLNDATGVDSFTLDSRAFLVLGSGQNITLTNPTSSTTASVNVTSTTTSTMIPTNTGPISLPQGLSSSAMWRSIFLFPWFQQLRPLYPI
ncbi:hypothetical protein BDZ45DRAFT_676180 [Acephala macrosclerotiorum]|nr:hypothetical protein BDZ45DRAFT_676180 [Acephala macrosclerotiorum]